MNVFENNAETRTAFRPNGPVVSDDGSISAFKSGDTSALRALQTIIEPGTLVDDEFVVGRLLGRGGIAAVYEAKQLDSGRDVALKVLDARFTGVAEIEHKFLEEGNTLAGFSHPNIVEHIAHGSDGTFVYIAMELVRGITLDQLIYAIPLENHHFLHLAREISKGLTRIHAEGVVHGDIKPSNILVTRAGEVKITDFGTAARMSAAGTVRGSGNKVTGTSAYMAPELFERNQNVDYRADVYSLGVTFYKVFTGKLPSTPIMFPSHLNAALPPPLDGLLMRAMQNDPEDRFVTVKEFSDALAALFDKDAAPAPVAITPDRQTVQAHEQQIRQSVAAQQHNDDAKKQGVDWKLVVVCGLAAVGVAAVLVGIAVLNNL